MFTGLIQKVGQLVEMNKSSGNGRITIACGWDEPLKQGESVSVQGACLTVVAFDAQNLECEVLDETFRKTNLGMKTVGDNLNLERAVQSNGRFGGHFVTGHVDGVGVVKSAHKMGRDIVLTINASKQIISGILLKGSVACDGVSLTVTDVSDDCYSVHLIPLTQKDTTLGDLTEGDHVNIETDMLGKYVRRYLSGAEPETGLKIDDLKRAGFI
jgi:riboflavin synthase